MHSSTKSTYLMDTAVVPGLHFSVVRVTGQTTPRGNISIWLDPFVGHHISPLQVCVPPGTVSKATHTFGGGVPRRMCPCCASLVYTCPSSLSLINNRNSSFTTSNDSTQQRRASCASFACGKASTQHMERTPIVYDCVQAQLHPPGPGDLCCPARSHC
jgi:hypothetical protein